MNKSENVIIHKKFSDKDNHNNYIIENDKFSENKNENIIEINEDKNKEFFSNSPVIYFFIKIILLFEGQITKILLQLGDLYFAGIITNIYLEIILIQVCASATSITFIKIYAFISGLIFSFLLKIIITIAYWELYLLQLY